jgi:hypothetical protein
MKKRIHKVFVEPIKDVSSPIVEIEQTGQLSGFLLLNALFLTLLFANILSVEQPIFSSGLRH